MKSCLEHLRSALDYLASAISVGLYQRPETDHAYFVYADDRRGFEARVEKAFPDLKARNAVIYEALEAAQPFKSDRGNWLPTLCRLTNGNKHIRLSLQHRKNEHTVGIARCDWRHWGR